MAAGDWWRALIVFAYMSGWRVGQLLALKWSDVDLDAGTAISQAEHNKGKRDCFIPLHKIVVEHCGRFRRLASAHVFPWDTNRRAYGTASRRFSRRPNFQTASQCRRGARAGTGRVPRPATWVCHDERGIDGFVPVQALMQHKTLTTTKLYVNMANRLTKAVEGLYVPDVGKRVSTPQSRTGSL